MAANDTTTGTGTETEAARTAALAAAAGSDAKAAAEIIRDQTQISAVKDTARKIIGVLSATRDRAMRVSLLHQLESLVPQDSTVLSAIAMAQAMVNESGSVSESPTRTTVENAMIAGDYLTTKELQTYNSFAGKKFELENLDEKGKPTGTTRTVDGRELQRAFAEIKLNSLSQEDQARVMRETAGRAATSSPTQPPVKPGDSDSLTASLDLMKMWDRARSITEAIGKITVDNSGAVLKDLTDQLDQHQALFSEAERQIKKQNMTQDDWKALGTTLKDKILPILVGEKPSSPPAAGAGHSSPQLKGPVGSAPATPRNP